MITGTYRRLRDLVRQWPMPSGRFGFWTGSLAVVAWTIVARFPALDPQTLWGDDVAVATLTRLSTLWRAISVTNPMAPGFVGLLWTARRLIDDPEISLQVLPLAFSLIGPLLMGLAVARLASSYLLGFIAVVLGVGNAGLAQYSVYVKPYSLDYAVTSLFLLLGVVLLFDGREWHVAVAVTGLAAALFSAPSVFLSLALVHVAAFAPGAGPRAEPPSKWMRWGTLAGFDVLLAALYLVIFASRANLGLQNDWEGSFAPSTSVPDFVRFLQTNGWTTLRDALPKPFASLAPLSVIGLAALVTGARSRWFGLFLATVYAGAMAASMLGVYPIGIGAWFRASIYTYALTTALVVLGLGAITRRMRARTPIHVAAAAVAVAVVGRLDPPVYSVIDQSQIVRNLEARVKPADALVLNHAGAMVAGYYASWPIDVRQDGSPFGYEVLIERGRTLTLPRLAEEEGARLDILDEFLARVRPPRVFLLSARRRTAWVERVIRGRGFVEVWRQSGDAVTELIEFDFAGSQQPSFAIPTR